MIKINLNDKILENHRKYIIDSNIEIRFEELKNNHKILSFFPNNKYEQEHVNLCKYIVNQVNDLKLNSVENLINTKNIFLGNVYNLHLINKSFSERSPLLFKFLNSKDKNAQKYKDIIINCIGYEEFSEKKLDDFFIIENRLCKKYSKKYISDRLQIIKHSNKSRYSKDEYLMIYNEILTDIKNIEMINQNNNTVDDNLIILTKEIRKYAELDLTKDKFIENVNDSFKRLKKCYENGYISLKNYKYYLEKCNKKELQWSAYSYVFELGIKVCPYCNRQYISPIYSENGKVRADLDHFYSKSKYPYLAMAIYNLIPCCKFCNSSLKGDREFTYENNINPYDEKELDTYMYFNYYPNGIKSFYGNDDVIIKLVERENVDNNIIRKFKNNIKTFQIEELYQYNTDIVKLMLKKKMIFTDEYLDNFYKNYKSIFKNKDEIIQILFNNSIEENKDEPFWKLKQDLINQIIKKS